MAFGSKTEGEGGNKIAVLVGNFENKDIDEGEGDPKQRSMEGSLVVVGDGVGEEKVQIREDRTNNGDELGCRGWFEASAFESGENGKRNKDVGRIEHWVILQELKVHTFELYKLVYSSRVVIKKIGSVGVEKW